MLRHCQLARTHGNRPRRCRLAAAICVCMQHRASRLTAAPAQRAVHARVCGYMEWRRQRVDYCIASRSNFHVRIRAIPRTSRMQGGSRHWSPRRLTGACFCCFGAETVISSEFWRSSSVLPLHVSILSQYIFCSIVSPVLAFARLRYTMNIMACPPSRDIKHNAVRNAHQLGVGTTPSEAAQSGVCSRTCTRRCL